MSTSRLLFVYGTLRSEFDNEFAVFLHKNAERLGNGTLKGKLYDLGWYPGAIAATDGGFEIRGEIFRLPAEKAGEIIAQLDEYECYGEEFEEPNEFLRQTVEADQDGVKFQCQTYLFNRSTEEAIFIPGGDYPEYLKEKGRFLNEKK